MLLQKYSSGLADFAALQSVTPERALPPTAHPGPLRPPPPQQVMFRQLGSTQGGYGHSGDRATSRSAHSGQFRLPHRRQGHSGPAPRPRTPTTTTTTQPHPDSTTAEDGGSPHSRSSPAGTLGGAPLRSGSSLQAGRRGPAQGGGAWSGKGRKDVNLPYVITPEGSRWSSRVFQGLAKGNRMRICAEAAECLVPGAKQRLSAGEVLPVNITFWDAEREAWPELPGMLKRGSAGHYYISVDSQNGMQDCTLVEGVTDLRGLRGQQAVVLSRRGGWVVLARRYMPWEQRGEQQQEQGEQQQQRQGLEGDAAALGPHEQRGGNEGAGVGDAGQSSVQLPARNAGTTPKPRVLELPPGTPVPQLPQPVLRVDVTGRPKHGEVVFEVDTSATASPAGRANSWRWRRQHVGGHRQCGVGAAGGVSRQGLWRSCAVHWFAPPKRPGGAHCAGREGVLPAAAAIAAGHWCGARGTAANAAAAWGDGAGAGGWWRGPGPARAARRR